ncbi:hypothetical protein AD951_05975 [Acetobacter malorum]|uniref:Uncharacterized protein n=1 Tax=Acetobacter malorum TaxID=178901 RepID=A0A149UNK4_9PROT|nr:hypothetical protein [Acetobacter malorum]KXV69561.1 hypothetical protein AD951_05975 [Acetobacter malorum]
MTVTHCLENSMARKYVWMVLAFAAFGGSSAEAAPPLTYGLGAQLCQKFNESPNAIKGAFYSWDEGFLSAVNDMQASGQGVYIPIPMDSDESKKRDSIVEGICAARPEILFKEATIEMMQVVIREQGFRKYK